MMPMPARGTGPPVNTSVEGLGVRDALPDREADPVREAVAEGVLEVDADRDLVGVRDTEGVPDLLGDTLPVRVVDLLAPGLGVALRVGMGLAASHRVMVTLKATGTVATGTGPVASAMVLA